MITLRKSGMAVEQGGVFLRKDGVLVEQEVYLRKGGVLTLIHSPGSDMALSYPPEAYGAGASNSEIAVTTFAVTVTVIGGRAPYAYLWALVGGPDPDWIITAPNAKTTAFRHFEMAPGSNYNTTVTCTVTDAAGHTAETDPISVTVENYGGLGGSLP